MTHRDEAQCRHESNDDCRIVFFELAVLSDVATGHEFGVLQALVLNVIHHFMAVAISNTDAQYD